MITRRAEGGLLRHLSVLSRFVEHDAELQCNEARRNAVNIAKLELCARLDAPGRLIMSIWHGRHVGERP